MKRLLIILFFIPQLLFAQATGKIIANKPSGGTLSLDSVNAYTSFNLNQTTAGQTINLASLTTGSKIIYLRNVGSASVTISPGGLLPVGKTVMMSWTGSAWSSTLRDGDGTYLPLSGGTLTGSLLLPAGGPSNGQKSIAFGGIGGTGIWRDTGLDGLKILINNIDALWIDASNVNAKGNLTVDGSIFNLNGVSLTAGNSGTIATLSDITGGGGTVSSVSVTTANGVSGSVANATTTPAITLSLGAITPTTVNGVTISGSSTPTLAVTGTTTVSGSNTGDQTTITGNAGTATSLQTARTINGTSFDGTSNITVTSAAGTLTGTTLNSTVVSSSLTSVGTVTSGSLGSGFTPIADAQISSATTWNAKQAALVSGTNIKTVNSNSLVGSGNVSVGDAMLSGNTFTGLNQYSGTGHVGLKLNNLTTTQRNLITPSEGMIFANTTTHQPNYYSENTWNKVEVIPEKIGEVFTENFTNLTNWTNVGTPSASVSGNKLTLAGTASLSTNYIRCSGYGRTNTEYALYEWQEIISTIGAGTSGKAFGIQGQDADFLVSLHVNLELSTTGTGRIDWFADNSTTAIQKSTDRAATNLLSGLASGDTAVFKLYRFPDRMMITVSEKGTLSTITDVLYFVYPTTSQVAINPPLGGQFAFYNRGGNHTIRDFRFTILDLKNPQILVIGNSITQARGATNRVVSLIQRRYRESVEVNATAGAQCEDINVAEVAYYKPKNILMWIGTNDIAFHDVATAQTNHAALVSALGGIGYSIANGNLKFGNVLPRGSSNYNTFNDYLVSTYGASNVLDLNRVVSDGSVTFPTNYSSDGIHPNYVGAVMIANYIGEYFQLTKNNFFNDIQPIERISITNESIIPNATITKATFTGGTIVDGTNAIAVTATLPTVTTATTTAITHTITSAGSSSFAQRAVSYSLSAGYTGSLTTNAGVFQNAAAGTGANLLTSTHNAGLFSQATATTTGYNVGIRNFASGGNVNVATLGFSTTLKNSATNGGGVFIGRNTGTSPVQFGVYAGLNSTDPTFVSAALIADNSDQTSPILLLRDNGTVTHTFADGGLSFFGGTTTPTARIHIAAGSATASTAPLKFTSGTNLTTPEAGAVEFDGTNYFASASTTRYTLAKTLTNTTTLNFDLTSVNSQDLTITVTGAADGDAVSVGVPNASATANVIFTWWVSGTNTVTIRASRIDVSSGADPASGTFRASVIKY